MNEDPVDDKADDPSLPGEATAVPRGRLSRLLQLGATASRMAAGGALERGRRLAQRAEEQLPSALLNASNARLLAQRLAHLRGAAMKVGQMLSLEGDGLLPPEFAKALEILRSGAHHMPEHQVRQVLEEAYGPAWQERFAEFDFEPIAAASIGQVHQARANDGRQLAIKLQYPGVADSIESDVDNLVSLVKLTRLTPAGVDLSAFAAAVKAQLCEEVDYTCELEKLQKYAQHTAGLTGVRLPAAYPELSTRRVLAMQRLRAPALLKWAQTAPQSERDAVGAKLLQLLLCELFQFGFMQTDPNPANYLYDAETQSVLLLDFGAAQPIPEGVSRNYRLLLTAVASEDRGRMLDALAALGLVHPGLSSPAIQVLLDCAQMVSEALARDAPYDFFASDLTERLHAEAERLRPFRNELRPPPPAYLFFQRKLAGTFLLERALRARVNCHQALLEAGLFSGQPA